MANVTRKEFYKALAVVWMYIMLLFGAVQDIGAFRWWGLLVLFVSSLLMFISSGVRAFRSRSESTGTRSGV